MEAPAQIPSAHLHMVYLHIYVYTHTSTYIHVYVYVYIHIYGVTVLRLPAEDYKCNFLLGAVHSHTHMNVLLKKIKLQTFTL